MQVIGDLVALLVAHYERYEDKDPWIAHSFEVDDVGPIVSHYFKDSFIHQNPPFITHTPQLGMLVIVIRNVVYANNVEP